MSRAADDLRTVGYFLKLAFVCVLSRLFVNPRAFEMDAARARPHRWYRAVERVGTDIVLSSHEIKRAGWKFWLKACFFTVPGVRALVANALVMAFFSAAMTTPLLVMWIMTPATPLRRARIRRIHLSTYCRDLIEVPVAMQLGADASDPAPWR